MTTDDNRDELKVWVGGLPPEVREQSLERELGKFGKLVDCRLRNAYKGIIDFLLDFNFIFIYLFQLLNFNFNSNT